MTTYPPQQPVAPKRSPLPWILLGCGCIALIGAVIVGILVAIGYPLIKKATSLNDEQQQEVPAGDAEAGESSGDETSTAADDDDPAAAGGAATPPSAASAAGGRRPPLGAYGCRTYGNPSNPIYIMQITLADGPYETDRGAGGTWSYDERTGVIEFGGGMLAKSDFVGMYAPVGSEVQYITGSKSKARSHTIYLQTRDRWDAHPGVTDAKTIPCALE